MTQSLENLIIVASTSKDSALQVFEGDVLHQLYIWNSSQPDRPKKIDISYAGGCMEGFSDLKIAGNKLIVANSERLLVYDLNDLDESPHEIKNAGECTDMLYIVKNKLMNMGHDVIQIRDLDNLDNINNPILAHEWASSEKTYASVKLDDDDNFLSAFSLRENDKELVIVNNASDISYVIDPKKCIGERLDLSKAGYRHLPGGDFPYFTRGIDFQATTLEDKILILSLNDWSNRKAGYASEDKPFSDIKVHSFQKKNGKYSLLEERPINLKKEISSILLDSKNHLKVLSIGLYEFELLTYDLKKDKIIDMQRVKTENKSLNDNWESSAYLMKVGGDLKVINQSIICDYFERDGAESKSLEDEIYLKSVSGKHDEIKLSGAKYLCQTPEISSIRPKFCEISIGKK